MKIATWNVNSIRARLEHVVEWLRQEQPDVLAVQETKTEDDVFPLDELQALGYQAAINGQKAYNGVAVLSRTPLDVALTALPGFPDEQRRVLGVKLPHCYLLNLYVPNGARVDSDKYAYKLRWLDALQSLTRSLLADHEQVVLAGDFNIAPEDRDVHDPAAWAGKVLCSPPEREALQKLLNLGLTDSFRRFEQPQGSFSWWDYRAGAFRRNHGLRIDLILASAALQDRCRRCWIDIGPRRLSKPSDHAPVLAEFDTRQP